MVTYDGAPHSFFDRKQEEFAAASDDAWGRVLEFVKRYSRAAYHPRTGSVREPEDHGVLESPRGCATCAGRAASR